MNQNMKTSLVQDGLDKYVRAYSVFQPHCTTMILSTNSRGLKSGYLPWGLDFILRDKSSPITLYRKGNVELEVLMSLFMI